MFATDWQLALLAVAALAHTVIAYHVYRRQRRDVDADRAADDLSESDASSATDGATVTCRHCGVENDSDYRYCRACVEQLPGGHQPAGPGGPPLGRVPR